MKPMVKGMERRTIEVSELRVVRAEGATPKIAGYAIVFESESVDLGGFTERIAKGALGADFATADIRALWNHDTGRVLGRTAAGTLRLSIDDHGLAFELDVPDTQDGRDALTLVERKDVTGMSFAFRTISDSWAKVAGKWLRTLLEIGISEISICTFPAYPATEAGIRANVDASEGLAAMKRVEDSIRISAEARRRRLSLVGRGLSLPGALRAMVERWAEARASRAADFEKFVAQWKEEHRDAALEDKIAAVWYALYDKLGSPWEDGGSYWHIVKTYPDRVIVETNPGTLFSYPLTFAADNTVTVGEPVSVVAEYVPLQEQGA